MNRRFSLIAIATFVSTWLALVLTAPGIPIIWDEGDYLERADAIVQWFHLGWGAFSTSAIQSHWHFINYSEGHPAGFAIPVAFSSWLFGTVIDPLTAARLGPITIFSVACAVVAVRLARDYGTTAAIVAPITLMTFPRMFGPAHFAAPDGQLTAWWLILWAVDTPIGASSSPLVGLVLGLTTASKFTGWLAWGPLVGWRVLTRDTRALRQLLVIVPIALLTFFVVNPPLWMHPIDGVMEHFHRNLDRANTFSVPVLFFGQIYNMQRSLPWYNTIVWTFLVTPVVTLVLGGVGLWRSSTALTKNAVALLLHGATLMVVRAMPGAPPHDGVRLFLPAFGFLCVLAGIGAQRAWNGEQLGQRPRLALRTIVVTGLLLSAVNLARYYPQTLSHYSPAIGGVRGAAALGMEPAYWWDAMDTDVLRWLNEHTDRGAAVAFSPVSNMTELHRWGRLTPHDVDPTKEDFQWYVLQNRPGMFTARDKALVAREKPVFVKFAGRRGANQTVPWDLDVPLIFVFSHEQYVRAR